MKYINIFLSFFKRKKPFLYEFNIELEKERLYRTKTDKDLQLLVDSLKN